MVSGLNTRPGSGSAPGLGAFTHSPDVTSGPDDVSVFHSVMRCLRPFVEGGGGGIIIAYSEVVWPSSRFSHNFRLLLRSFWGAVLCNIILNILSTFTSDRSNFIDI